MCISLIFTFSRVKSKTIIFSILHEDVMKRKIICTAVIGIAAVSLLEISRCAPPLAGNGSQTPNGQVSAMVYNTDGTPAKYAKVMFYPINYNPHTGGLGKTATSATVDSTTTNDSGNYTAMLDSGTYNIIASGDGNLAYQDSSPP